MDSNVITFYEANAKPRVYLDTSVISYLDQQDAPEKMAETKEERSMESLEKRKI